MKNQQKIWGALYKKHGSAWKKEAISLPKLLKNKMVLELGVGNGKTLISILKQKPSFVAAIDQSKEAIKYCKSKFKNISNIKFKKCSALNLPFEVDSFDIIVCYYILNNLSKKQRVKAVKEIKRVLKPRGIVLFEDFASGDFRQKNGKKAGEKNTVIKNSGLVCHFFTKNEILSLFKGQINKIEEKIFHPYKDSPKRKIISATIYQ